MIRRQYHAQRRQGGNNPLGTGVIAVGTIFYLQDEGWWRDRYRGAPIRRNPWIVDAFLNGTMGAARRDRATGLWEALHFGRAVRHGRRPIAARRPPSPGCHPHPHPAPGSRPITRQPSL